MEDNVVTLKVMVNTNADQNGNAHLLFLDANGVQFMRICVNGHMAERILMLSQPAEIIDQIGME